MGFMDKIRAVGGGVSPELLQNGTLARGEVVNVEMTGMSVSRGDQVATEKQVCNVTLKVMMDNTPPFEAKVHQGIPVLVLRDLQSGSAVVAVRVNPNNHQEVAIDFNSDPPTVTMSQEGPNRGSAAELLATGTPARAVIIQSEPLGMRSPAGLDMYAFVVTILCEGHAPYQTKMGNPVTAAGVPLIYPGSNLPAKVRPGEEGEVIIDWDAAVAEVTQKAGA
jgi:hypothetical protein